MGPNKATLNGTNNPELTLNICKSTENQEIQDSHSIEPFVEIEKENYKVLEEVVENHSTTSIKRKNKEDSPENESKLSNFFGKYYIY